MIETITEMMERHCNEKRQLRKDCKHPIKYLIKRTDNRCIGRGSIYPRRDIICKLCGIKKMVFDEKSWKGIKKTMKKTNLKDERISFIQYNHELEK